MRGEVGKKTPKKGDGDYDVTGIKSDTVWASSSISSKIEYIPLTNNVDPIEYFTRKIIIKVV